MIWVFQCQAVVTCWFRSCWRTSELMALPRHDVEGKKDMGFLAMGPFTHENLFDLRWHHVVTTRQAGSFLKHLISDEARESGLCKLTYCCQCRWMQVGQESLLTSLFDSSTLWMYWHSLTVNFSSHVWKDAVQLNSWFLIVVQYLRLGKKQVSHS